MMRTYFKPEWLQAILLGVGTMFAAGTFWYKDVHAPAVSPATLTIEPSMETIGRRGNSLLVRASLRIENRSDYRVYVPAFWYTVRGYCYQPRAMSRDSYETELAAWREGGVHSRYNAPARGDLLVAGRPSPRKDSYYDPGSERRYEELFLVPAEGYGALRMEVQYMVAKDVSEIDTTRWSVAGHAAREQVFIRTGRAGPPSAANAFAPAGAEPYDRVEHRAWRERAGAAWGWSHASLSLWPLQGGASADAETHPAAGACAG